MVVGGYAASGRMGFVLMPRSESNYAIVTAVLPYGSPASESLAVRDPPDRGRAAYRRGEWR